MKGLIVARGDEVGSKVNLALVFLIVVLRLICIPLSNCK